MEGGMEGGRKGGGKNMMSMHMQKNVKTPKDNFTLCFSSGARQ